MHKSFCILLSFLILGNLIKAQEVPASPWRLGLKYGKGFMITHSPIMEYVSEQHFSKSELILEKRLNGTKEWHDRYGYPYAGMSISHFNFDKKEFFGEAISLSPYYSFSIVNGQKLDLRLRTTVGAGWIEKTFDLEENHKNVAIGSQLNLFFGVLMEMNYHPSDEWGFSMGINYSHFSNTGFQNPNLGINLPTIELGIVHQFGKDAELIKEAQLPETKKEENILFNFRWANGISDNYPVGGPKFLASAMSFEVEKEMNQKSNLGMGLDFYYNPAQKSKLAQDSIYIDSGWENLQLGISAHHLMKFGKFGCGIKAGFYLKKEDDDLRNIYTEVYGQHPIWKDLSAFFSLKTHLARAEYSLLGIKYRLK